MELKRRTFTKEFKQQLVEQIVKLNISPSQLAREHNIHRVVLHRWVKQYQTGSPSTSRTTQTKMADLEALVGRLLIDNELLKKALKAVNEPPKPKGIISGGGEIPLEP